MAFHKLVVAQEASVHIIGQAIVHQLLNPLEKQIAFFNCPSTPQSVGQTNSHFLKTISCPGGHSAWEWKSHGHPLRKVWKITFKAMNSDLSSKLMLLLCGLPARPPSATTCITSLRGKMKPITEKHTTAHDLRTLSIIRMMSWSNLKLNQNGMHSLEHSESNFKPKPCL